MGVVSQSPAVDLFDSGALLSIGRRSPAQKPTASVVVRIDNNGNMSMRADGRFRVNLGFDAARSRFTLAQISNANADPPAKRPKAE